MRFLIFFLLILVSNILHGQQVVELCEDSRRDFVYLSSSSQSGTWIWTVNGNVVSDSSSASIEWIFPGTYEIEAQLISVCPSEVRTFTVTVQECRTSSVYFSNSFTPNEDGVNDDWGPVTKNILTIEWSIWNRWGERIFQSNEIYDRWRFQSASLLMNEVYTYQANWRDVHGRTGSKIGHVTVIK